MRLFIYTIVLLQLLLSGNKARSQQPIDASQLYNLNPADPVDNSILQKSLRYDSLLVFTKIWLSDQVGSQFDPLFGIVINKRFILDLAKKNKIEDVDNLFSLIIAHEKMHAFQFMRLQSAGRTIGMLTTEEMQLLECQADMVAGYFCLFPHISEFSALLTRSFLYTYRTDPQTPKKIAVPEFNKSDFAFINDFVPKVKNGATLFFSIGEKEGIFGHHPNPIYRKQAFEIGVDAFALAALNLPLPQDLMNSIQPSEWGYLKGRYNVLMTTLGVMPSDYNPQGVFLELWSYRTALKILHIVGKASNNLIFTINKNHWDTSLQHPFLHFSIEITNNNPDSVIVDLDVPIKLVSRKYPEDPLSSSVASAWHSLVVLASGESKVLTDSVMWLPGSDTTMPKVFYPGEEGSFYRVFAFRPRDPKIYVPAAGKAEGLPLLTDRQIMKVSGLLETIRRDFISYPLDYFKDGAGLIWSGEDAVRYNFYKGDTHFTLQVPLDRTKKTLCSTVIAKYNEFPEAETELNRVIEEIKNTNYIVADPKIPSKHFKYVLLVNKTDRITAGALYISKQNSQYELTMNIYKP